jgi:uncharacterized protein YprB with RNaseH-like and TPR domain
LIALGRLKKAELVWMASNRCKHRHLYICHPNCYEEENPSRRREGYLDIETSNLKADYGICYCYSIKVRGKDKFYERVITKQELRTCLDKKVVQQFIDDLRKFDKTYGYYSSGFDLKFMRTRALYHGLVFPAYGEGYHKDLYFTAKGKLATSSKKLKVVAKTVLGNTQKTELEPRYWITAMSGDKKALDYIAEHCRYDVIDLELIHNKLEPFYKESDTSI